MKTAMCGLAVLGLAAGFSVTATPAAAIGTDGQFVECLFAFPNQTSDPNSCALTGGGASVSGSLVISPSVLITVNASGAGVSAEGFLGYDFNILGGSAGDVVDIAVTAELVTSLTGNGSAFGQLFWENPDLNGQVSVCASTDPAATACPGNNVFNGTVHFDGTVGDLQHLQMFISASGGTFGSGFASADPFIQVTGITDPTGIYGVQTTGGVANALPGATGGVPEPSAWALLLAGFASVGVLARRRRLAAA